jgi:hypothetical protein
MEGEEDAMLMALNMEDGATSQERKWPIEARKAREQGHTLSPYSLQKVPLQNF